jgi:hypothetical protein
MSVYIHLEQVRNAGRALGSVMGPLLEEVQEGYRQHHHSCLLYLASEIIKVIHTTYLDCDVSSNELQITN